MICVWVSSKKFCASAKVFFYGFIKQNCGCTKRKSQTTEKTNKHDIRCVRTTAHWFFCNKLKESDEKTNWNQIKEYKFECYFPIAIFFYTIIKKSAKSVLNCEWQIYNKRQYDFRILRISHLTIVCCQILKKNVKTCNKRQRQKKKKKLFSQIVNSVCHSL